MTFGLMALASNWTEHHLRISATQATKRKAGDQWCGGKSVKV